MLKDGATPVVWHQWYGSYRTRLREAADVYSIAEAGERAFMADYPQLVMDQLSPAWGPERDVEAEQRAGAASRLASGGMDDAVQRVRRWTSRRLRVLAARIAVRRDHSRLRV